MSAHDPKPAHDDSSDLPFAPTLRKTIIILLIGFATPVIVLLLLVHFISAGAPSEANSTVAADTAPVGQVAVASAASNAATTTTTAPAAASAAVAAASPAPASPTTTADAGKALYTSTCIACHGAGIAGAPKVGDKAEWAPRIAQGLAVLDDHAIHGFQGKSGMMPPKGGSTASDDDVKAAVAYMVAQSK
ncbi:cytochrome c-555 precursor [mine drainage metagenome]|uniref:Cytochrome c-555 n=1 Tax=mine drainage metagenome TaxID=410659 RepID=A0A1J5QZ92_9ZZZZ